MAEFKIERIDETSYSNFLDQNPPEDPFSLPTFLSSCKEAFSVELIFLLILRNETPVAVCSFSSGRRLWYPIIQLVPARTYDGVHFRTLAGSTNQKQEYEKLEALQALEEYLERNYSFHQIIFPPGLTDIRAHQWAGATILPQYTYVVDLAKFSEVNYTKSLKEVLRAARGAGLHTSDCTVEQLTKLQQLSYKRHDRRAPIPVEKLNRLLDLLSSNGLINITAVRNYEGELISALATIRTKARSFFYVSGTRPWKNEAEKGASHLVYH
ncbi:MAG: hypothetical protein M1339_08190 [Bacteroidetes bacterium]|nr:hypothetical protein [Bacteroidota bacterium]